MSQFNNINLNNCTVSPFLKTKLNEQNKAPINPFFTNNQTDVVEIDNTKANDAVLLEESFEKTKAEQGLVGKTWDGIKNLLHLKSGSSYVENSIKDFNNGKITKETAQEILTKYQDGQNTCVDIVADIASSIVAVGVFSFATGGLGLPAALGLSFLSGAGIKAGGKAFGAKANDREYNGKNLLYDIVTGGVNGLFAPITNGLGSNLTKTIGSKLGLEILGDVAENTTKAAVKSSFKSILLNQSIDVAGGNIGKRAIALGAGMALDGALSGTADNVARATLDKKDAKEMAQAGLQGFLGGLIMSPIVGGGFRLAGKAGKKLSQKLFKNRISDTSATGGTLDIQETTKQPKNTTAEVSDAPIVKAENTTDKTSDTAEILEQPKSKAAETPEVLETKGQPKNTTAEVSDAPIVKPENTTAEVLDIETDIKVQQADIDAPESIAKVEADVETPSNATKRNIVAAAQPVEIQKARFDELTKINLSEGTLIKLPDEFIERASKDFSPERYELLLRLATSTNEADKLFYMDIPDILDNCDDEAATILTDLFGIKSSVNNHRMGIADCKEAIELDNKRLECLKDVLTKQTEDYSFFPWQTIGYIKELSDEQLTIFSEFSHIDGIKATNQLKLDEVKAIAQTMPVENLEYVRRCLSELKDKETTFKPIDIVENFSKCSKEKAASLESIYRFLLSDKGSRVHSWNLGNFLDEATAKELELAKKLLSLTNSEGQFIIDGYYKARFYPVEQEEPLLSLFFKKHSEAKYLLIDEFLKYPNAKDKNRISDILRLLDDEQADFIKRNLVIEGRNDWEQFYNESITSLSHIKKEDIEFIEKNGLLYLPEREDQYAASELEALAKLGDSGLKTAKERGLFTTKESGGEFYLDGWDVLNLVTKVEDKDWQKAKEILDIIAKDENLIGINERRTSDIIKLAQLSDSDFEKAKNLINVKGRPRQFSADSIIELTKLDLETIDKAKQRNLLVDSRCKGEDVAPLASLSDADFEKIKPVMQTCEEFSGQDLKNLAELPDDEFQRAQSLFHIPERDAIYNYNSEQFSAGEIVELSKLSKEQFENIQPFLGYTANNSDTLYTRKEVMKLATLSANELKRAQEFINVPKRTGALRFDADGIIALLKLSPEELEKAKKYFYIEDFGYKQLSGRIIALLQKYEGVKSIDALTIRQKRELLKDLIRENNILFGYDYDKIANCRVIPNSQEEYCAILPKLVKSIGISTNDLSDKIKTDFYQVLSSIEAPNSRFRTFDFENPNVKLDLTYSRASFVSDMADILAPLSKEERNTVCNYFGFELISKNGKHFMNGYPVNLNNGVELAQIDSPQLKQIIEKMRPLVKNFSENNSVTIQGEPELSRELNGIIKAFPEFITEIGRKQHHTHSYTLDVHSLKVLQGVVNNPKYDKLPDDDKFALKIAALLHDITKQENLRDYMHPTESAFDVYYLLQKLNLSEDEKLKIYQIVKDHNWLQRYNAIELIDGKKVPITPYQRTKVAKDIAFDLRKGNSFEMASILTEADMQAVKRGGKFFEGLQDVLDQGENEVGAYVKQIKESAIHLPQTKIPKASKVKVDGDKVKDVVTTLKDGSKVTNRVIFLEPGMDLSKYGFSEGLTSDNLNVLIHALDKDKQSAIFQALGQIDSDALLSSSYVNYGQGNFHAFRNQGFVLYVDSDDINAGYFRDFGSGYEKNLEILKTRYLFNGENKKYRNYISEQLKEILGLNDAQYIKLYNKIKNKTIGELDCEYPDVAKAMRELFVRMEGGKRKGGRKYNEMLITRPKIQAVFDYGTSSDISNIPDFLRQYAAENDYLIMYFGK